MPSDHIFATSSEMPRRRTRLATSAIAVALVLTALIIAGVSVWTAGALYFAGPGGARTRAALALIPAATGLAIIAAVLSRRWRPHGIGAFLVGVVVFQVWWSSVQPSNARDWQPEVAVMPRATIQGDLITVHNIRDFEYRSEHDFSPRYYDRTFDLRRLDRVDLLAVHWMGPAIAHVFVSFGFGDDHLAISIEARKERFEPYSTLAGFFRQYELIYVVGDERDLIRLRTNYRNDPPEDVYLYRLQAPVENGRRLFTEYMNAINALTERPKFYNTLTSNCTNVILLHTRVNPDHLHYSWKILLSGYTPEYVYDAGKLDRSLPFDELKRRSRINEAALAADQAPDFSRRIREALPSVSMQ
jgi:hypothetical protein